jgi:cyclopropane fatty-acyl-phospholipid synthase-like methyltransferase
MWRRYIRKQPALGAIQSEVRLHNLYWEKRFGIQTGGWQPTQVEDGTCYEGTPYLIMLEVLRTWQLGPDDVFVDLGCGKGRTLCMAARSNVGRVIGVEQEQELIQQARANVTAVADARAQVEFFQGMAQDFDFDGATAILLFNPFGARTLQEVLTFVRASLDRNPRRLRLVYINPVHEQVLEQTEWLQNTQTWPSAAYPEFIALPPNPRLVSFWETH